MASHCVALVGCSASNSGDSAVIRHQPVPRRHLHGEEVRGGQDLPVQLQELGPTHPRFPTLRGGFQVVATQDIAYGQLVDGMPQIRESTLDPSIAPGRIFFGHLDHELLDLLSDTRSATRSSLRIPIKLVGDQLLVPPQEGVGSDKGRHVLQALAAEWVGQRREAAPFGIREAKATTAELGFEHAVFRQKIRDDLLLVTLQPASNHGNQNMKDHRRS